MTQPRRDVAIYFRQSTPVSGEVPAKPDRQLVVVTTYRCEGHDRNARDRIEAPAQVEGTHGVTSRNGRDLVS